MGLGISTGIGQILTSMPADRSMAKTFLVEISHGAGLKRKCLHDGVAGFKNKLVVDEIEAEFE